jgi:hypothetical protein
MWKCPLCELEFVRDNQVHSCHDSELADFLNGKSLHTLELFDNLVAAFKLIDEGIVTHPTKSMITFRLNKRFAYVTQLGKNFIDVVLPLKQAYADNLCFNKIKPVPGSDDYNHHLRLYFKEDINTEVMEYMRFAYHNGI